MITQIVFYCVYMIFELVTDKDKLNNYHFFNLTLIFWFIPFNLFFMRNAMYRFLVQEFIISAIAFSLLVLYTTCKYAASAIELNRDEQHLFDGTSSQDHMYRLVYIMNLIGITINLFTLPLYLVVSYCFYQDMMKVIIHHCDGQDIMFNNF